MKLAWHLPARAMAALLLMILAACSTLVPEFDPPQVSVESFNSIPGQGGAPRFEIKLRVANPNKQSLDIAGISYNVELLGKRVMSGVTNDVPTIEPYSEEVVTLEVGLQLFQVLRLFNDLGRNRADALDYRFSAKIDFNGFIPTQRVEEVGEITL